MTLCWQVLHTGYRSASMLRTERSSRIMDTLLQLGHRSAILSDVRTAGLERRTVGPPSLRIADRCAQVAGDDVD